MPNTALMLPDNISHNVPAALEVAKTHLTDLATLYLVTEVAGQSQATLDAKHRDLQRFLSFYQHLYGHDRPEGWFVSVTKAFLKHLRRQRLAQASLVRIYATVRHFARWLHRKFPDLFPLGCPTDGVKLPAEPTDDWKGLTHLELHLLNAARVRPSRVSRSASVALIGTS
jgi:site-specific recombinase XerD